MRDRSGDLPDACHAPEHCPGKPGMAESAPQGHFDTRIQIFGTDLREQVRISTQGQLCHSMAPLFRSVHMPEFDCTA